MRVGCVNARMFSTEEDCLSGSRSAIAGGVTARGRVHLRLTLRLGVPRSAWSICA